MTPKDFHVGQILYIGARPATNMHDFLGMARVISIGKKWVKFAYILGGHGNGRFSMEDGLVDNGEYSPDKVAVFDPDVYYDIVDAIRLRNAVIINYRAFQECDLQKLKEIIRITGIKVKLCERKYHVNKSS